MFQTKFAVKFRTHIFVFNNIFFFENRAVYEIILKNTVEPDIDNIAHSYCVLDT